MSKRLPREVALVLSALESLQERAGAMARLVEDVYVLAYDKPAAEPGTRSGTRQEWYLDEQGQSRAQEVFARLAGTKRLARTEEGVDIVLKPSVAELDKDLGRLLSAVTAIFAGPGADNTLTGTLLGEWVQDEEGRWVFVEGSAKKELAQLRRAQRRRLERGEYVPARSQPQPEVNWRGG